MNLSTKLKLLKLNSFSSMKHVARNNGKLSDNIIVVGWMVGGFNNHSVGVHMKHLKKAQSNPHKVEFK